MKSLISFESKVFKPETAYKIQGGFAADSGSCYTVCEYSTTTSPCGDTRTTTTSDDYKTSTSVTKDNGCVA